MSLYLTFLSAFAASVIILVFFWNLKRGRLLEIKKYAAVGTFVAVFNFVIEYLGTSTGNWTYHHSLFHIFGLIPVELILIFFGAGVAVRFIYLQLRERKMSINLNKVFPILLIPTFGYYVIWSYLGGASLLPFSMVFGLWGIYNISEENRDLSILLALAAFLVDLVLETLIIGSGGYSYKHNFTLSVPVIYAFLTVGLVNVVEKIEEWL